jgi:dTDP-4-amino-4,6-dideoxygalactose transaminase
MSSPDLTEAERKAVIAVLDTPLLSMGPQEKAFEDAVASYSGREHAIAVNSGTAGLHLCVRAAGITEGDLVITTPFSFVASANVLLYERATPIFVDVDPRTGNIDPLQVAKAAEEITAGGSEKEKWLPRKGAHYDGKLRALLPIDVFGQPAEYDQLLPIAEKYGLDIIEDSCEAFGSEFRGESAGSFGRAAVFAFYPNKQMTTGEGGVVVTDDGDWAAMIRSLRNQGRAPGDTWLAHSYLGYNYRLDELSAALGVVQVARLDELIEKRGRVADWYSKQLSEIEGIEVPWVTPETTRMSWFVYVVRFDPSIDRDGVVRELKVLGIPSRPYFAPIHMQKYMVDRFGYRQGDFPIAEDLGKRGLALPFSSVMTEGEVERVCEGLRGVVT